MAACHTLARTLGWARGAAAPLLVRPRPRRRSTPCRCCSPSTTIPYSSGPPRCSRILAEVAAATAAGGQAAPAAASCPVMARPASRKHHIDRGESVRGAGAAGTATIDFQHSCCSPSRRDSVCAGNARREPLRSTVVRAAALNSAVNARVSSSTRAQAAHSVEYLLLLQPYLLHSK